MNRALKSWLVTSNRNCNKKSYVLERKYKYRKRNFSPLRSFIENSFYHFGLKI